MIIMISSQGENLQSQPNLRFGRTPFFIRYDLEADTWDSLPNSATGASGGAGVSAAQLLINQKASAALSGRFGPNANQALSSAGIKMFTFDASCQTVEDVINRYKNNDLKESSEMGSF